MPKKSTNEYALQQEVLDLRRQLVELRAREVEHIRRRNELEEELACANKKVRELSATGSIQTQPAHVISQLKKAKRKAETATRAKSDFLANMSHELRSPLTAILGFTEALLEEGDLSRAPHNRIQYLHTIKRNGQHLMRILTDILDLSKIEAGKIDLEILDTSPCEVISDIESVMRSAAEAKNIGFDIVYSGSIPARIQTDPTRLRQILLNLVGNAVKFTQEGGVCLTVKLIEDEAGAPLISFGVSDTGTGLPPEALDRIFETFSQADASTTRKFGGTGLGLPISRQLARLLGGDILAETIEGQGSTFTLTIGTGELDDVEMLDDIPTKGVRPFALPGDEESTLWFMDQVKESQPERRILLVEDGEDNRRLIALILRKCGFEVAFAENGQVGMTLAVDARDAGEPFDLILMDMQMPVMDGYEATRQLRAANYQGPIIALTAHAMKGDRHRCLEAGCNDFATKPISRRDLVKTVLDHLPKAGTSL
jgi:signal transduction histidine kinase/CheY-like chemotaxis protein